MATVTRSFRVFVSSTFEDLRKERDALQATVFPKLERFCLERGARFQAIDLRWGVREQAALDQKTMEICLAEIARCQKTQIKPNFIVLLGERYGWRPAPARIPETEFEALLAHIGNPGDRDFVQGWYDLDKNAVPPERVLKPRREALEEWSQWEPVEQRLRHSLVEAARAAGLPPVAMAKYEASATHQEILQGLSETEEDRQHVFAFFRESLAPVEPDLQKLKEHLRRRLPRENIFSFAPAELARLCDAVERSLTTVIADTADRFEEASERSWHDQFAQERARSFFGRQSIIDAIDDALEEDGGKPVVLQGPSGSGKSAIMAVASNRRNTVRRFIGATPEASNGVTLLRSLCAEIRESFGQTGQEPTTFEELATAFAERLKLATAARPLLLFIDALDQLGEHDPAAPMRWLPAELPPHCGVVLSTTAIVPALQQALLVPVEPLPVEDAGLALDAWLAQAGRTLQPPQRHMVLARFRESGLPLYLRLAFEQARAWRSFDAVDEHALEGGLQGIIGQLFSRLSHPSNHGEAMVSAALGYLAAARQGLTEDEILAVLAGNDAVWNDVVGSGRRRHDPPARRLPVSVWSRLFLDLEPYLAERSVPGGTAIGFYHRQLTESVQTTANHHRELAAYFARQPNWFESDVPNQRKITELARQQVGAGLLDNAAATLTDLDFISAKCAAGLVFDLEEDYREAIRALPEANEALAEEERRRDEAARWTATLIACARQKRRPHEHEIIQAVGDNGSEPGVLTAARPARFDRLDAFSTFVQQEIYALIDFGHQRGFVASHAFNRIPEGPVHREAQRQTSRESAWLLLRRWTDSDRTPARPALLRTLQGHNQYVWAMSVTADCRRAVSGGEDGAVRVWDLETGACLSVLEGYSAVCSVSVTPDGRFAAVGCVDQMLHVWDLQSAVRIHRLQAPAAWAGAVRTAILPDGREAISGSARGMLIVWDLERGTPRSVLCGHGGKQVYGVSITPDATLAVSGGEDGAVMVWDLASGECIHTLDGHAKPVVSIAMTPDGRRAVSASRDGTLRVWDPMSGICLHVLDSHTAAATTVSMTPDGRRAVSGGDDSTVRVWNLETGQLLRTLRGHHTYEVSAVCVTPDGRRAVSASRDRTLRVWDLEAPGRRQSDANRPRGVWKVGASPDGRRAVSSGGSGGTLAVWDLETGACLRLLEGHSLSARSITLMRDGQRAVSGSTDGTIRVWDLDSGTCLRVMEAHQHGVNGVSLANGAKWIVSCGQDSTVRVWDLENTAPIRTWEGHTQPIPCLCVTPDGRRAVSGSQDRTLRVWDVETGDCLHILTGHTDSVHHVTATPDGRYAVSASWGDAALRVWNLDTGVCVRTLEGEPFHTWGLIVPPDGRRLISWGSDYTLRVWDLMTGTCLHVLEGHKDSVWNMGVQPRDGWAVSASEDQTLRVWDLESGRCLAVARLMAPCRAAVIVGDNRMVAWTEDETFLFDLIAPRSNSTGRH